MKYIDEKVSDLDMERKALQEEIVTANVTDTEGRLKQITNHIKAWETLSFEDRQTVVDTLIKVIRIADGILKSHGIFNITHYENLKHAIYAENALKFIL